MTLTFPSLIHIPSDLDLVLDPLTIYILDSSFMKYNKNI